jgi:cytosine/adenosine deaminase-related metal-dependent hydrolase
VSRPHPDLVLGARLVFPVDGPPIENGRVTLSGPLIRSVSGPSDRSPDLDLGNVAITPGFVNAHTHLELPPIPGAGPGPEDEIDWLSRVISQRFQLGPNALREAVDRNLAQALAAGTTLLADTTTAGLSWPAVSAAPVRSVVFSEVVGLRRMRGVQTSQDAWDWIAGVGDNPPPNARPGISPHAPYSTAGWLYHRAAECGLPVSTHLAEMPEERQLLADRSGRLRSFLETLGAWDDDWEPLGPSPADYLRLGSPRTSDWVVAHANDFSPSDFWLLRPPPSPDSPRVSVAYCPRTHARFGHPPHPFRSMLEAGLIVCLGTDSLASSPTLSILDEIRFLSRSDPSLPGPLLLTMATLFGAWALRSDHLTGTLSPGKSADLAITPLPDLDSPDPHSLLLDSDLPVLATIFSGSMHHGPAEWRF